MQSHEVNRLIFLDESGAHLSLDREYARIIGGERIHVPIPYTRGHRYTLMSAIGVESVKAAVYGEWSANGEIFSGFISQCLLPNLRQGDVVIMDNVSFHKVKGIQQMIESVGASLLYLPPYSPDLSPIENMWSKIKTYLRKYAPRTPRDFKKVIKKAFESVTQKDLKAWFKFCGYTVSEI